MDDDLDGEPMQDDLRPSHGNKTGMPAGFVPSRWETVDPEQVEAQAMTTSKWDMLDQSEQQQNATNDNDDEDSVDGTANDDSMECEYESRSVVACKLLHNLNSWGFV